MSSGETATATTASATAATNSNTSITLIAKFGKEQLTFDKLSPDTTIGEVKRIITERTGVLSKRQKLIGLSANSSKKVTDDIVLSDLKVKQKNASNSSDSVVTHKFILMGTPEEKIFVDPNDKDDLPDVVDDFDLDFNAGSREWCNHVEAGQNLTKFTEKTNIHVMNDPRPNKPLLVLDLDHTLLDFSSKTILNSNNDSDNTNNNMSETQQHILSMKRPYMDEFLTRVYQHYDLVVWSQTSWRWLETKLIELGMVSHSKYKFCFVLDKTSMFRIISTNKSKNTEYKHSVKPLQIIWNKSPGKGRWDEKNTVHLDDLSRNFALNLQSGLKVTPYYRKKSSSRRDSELLGLSQYLEELATSGFKFNEVNFEYWQDVVSGKRTLSSTVLPSSLEDGGGNNIDGSNN